MTSLLLEGGKERPWMDEVDHHHSMSKYDANCLYALNRPFLLMRPVHICT